MLKIEGQISKIPKIPKKPPKQLTFIPLTRPEKDVLKALEYINHTCHNTHRDSTSGKYMIKIPRFDSGTPEEWIIFMDLFQESLVRQNVTSDPPMYKCMKSVLKGDAKAKLLQTANLVGGCTVANFTTVMTTMTVHVFLTYTSHDHRQYMQRYIRKPPDKNAWTFTKRSI